MEYNYMDAVKADIRDYIEENIDLNDFSGRTELKDKLNELLWVEDSVTGNASGSYTFKSLYHASIKECLEHLNGTLKPILYNGKDINPVRDCESILLSYNPRTGEVYRPIDWKKYYSLINAMEM